MDHKKNVFWWQDEGFWNDFAPLMFDSGRWADAVADVEGLLDLVNPEPSIRILDAGCGPGRHAVELASRGFSVTGVDIQENYLEEARKRSESVEKTPIFLNSDLRTFTTDENFGGAVSMFQSIGYTDDEEDDLAICRSIRESLEPGGWFLMESDGKEALAGNFEERTWMERNGRIILLEYEAEGAWSRLRNRWMFRDTDGSWHEYEFSYRLYSAVELGRLLERAGFASIEFFGGMDGRPYDHDARNLVALARRA